MNPRGTSEKPYLPVLFREFPELEENTPRISLGAFPTPIQRLNRIGYVNLWIKRDDMSSHVYGGNKIRKLEIILGKAGRKKTGHIITFGGIGTNHGLATAIFCQKLGIKCTLLLFRQPVTAGVKKNLLLFNKFKADTIYKASPWKTVMSYFLLERIKHPGAYFVYVGGSSPEGTIGYVNAAFELKEQIDRGEMSQPEVILCPLGSGGTLAGLSLGLQLAGLQTSAMGVRVSESHLGPFQACTKDTIERLMKRTYAYLKKRCQRLPDITIRLPEILHDYFGSGYGAPTRAGSKAHHLMQEKEGIMLDPTYTAKTFAAVLDYCRNHQSDHGPVLYWHTNNSVDLTDQARGVDYRNLPEPLQRFIKQKSVEL
jgi:D-cysteine desulfhydrase